LHLYQILEEIVLRGFVLVHQQKFLLLLVFLRVKGQQIKQGEPLEVQIPVLYLGGHVGEAGHLEGRVNLRLVLGAAHAVLVRLQ